MTRLWLRLPQNDAVIVREMESGKFIGRITGHRDRRGGLTLWFEDFAGVQINRESWERRQSAGDAGETPGRDPGRVLPPSGQSDETA